MRRPPADRGLKKNTIGTFQTRGMTRFNVHLSNWEPGSRWCWAFGSPLLVQGEAMDLKQGLWTLAIALVAIYIANKVAFVKRVVS